MGAVCLYVKSFAKNLKYFRKRAGFTQQEFAEKVNISYSFYVKLENSNNLPGWDNLFTICETLNIPIEFLIKDSGKRVFAEYANYKMVQEMQELDDDAFALLSQNIELLYRYINGSRKEEAGEK